MISKLFNTWQILKGSLWFIPAVFCCVYFVFTLAVHYFETRNLSGIELPPFFFNGDYEDAKSVSIALLSSMITMTTLAISVTMVVLSLAAAQLGPRLIKTFMSDRKTQDFIGLFFGSVIACFLLTIILHDAAPDAQVPRITVNAVFAICFANLFVLLAFVHHVAKSSIADQVILAVTDDLKSALERLTKDDDLGQEKNLEKDWPKDFEHKAQQVFFNRGGGYIQYIDYDYLMDVAEKYKLYILVNFKAGHFVVHNENGVRVYPTTQKFDDEIAHKIRSAFIIGDSRTSTQDIEYSIRHLVEMGLRALSPGINDNFTAMTVLDHLSSCLAILFTKKMPSVWFTDEEDKPRLWAKQNSVQDIVFSAFDQIRDNAKEKPDVLYHLLKKIDVLSAVAQKDAHKQGLRRQLEEISVSVERLGGQYQHIESLKNLIRKLKQSL